MTHREYFDSIRHLIHDSVDDRCVVLFDAPCVICGYGAEKSPWPPQRSIEAIEAQERNEPQV